MSGFRNLKDKFSFRDVLVNSFFREMDPKKGCHTFGFKSVANFMWKLGFIKEITDIISK